jgi:hypothetical protein
MAPWMARPARLARSAWLGARLAPRLARPARPAGVQSPLLYQPSRVLVALTPLASPKILL